MSNEITVIESVKGLRSYVRDLRQSSKSVALVPTMGALHDGHMTLVTEALNRADTCIVSIFVNPTQFAPDEDLDAYPRTWNDDLEKIIEKGGQAVFFPSVAEIYPPGFATTVSVAGITETLEGVRRPGHFDGVATIVTKLLLQTLPDIALFGEKDYQQLQLIRRMVADLNIPVNIISMPTVRDKNGLALSSRNRYLDEKQYEIACTLNRTLTTLAEEIANGNESYKALEQQGEKTLLDAGFEAVDYVAIRDAATLQTPDEKTKNLRILAAAWLGTARLIDNRAVEET